MILSTYLNRTLNVQREAAAAALSEFARYRYVLGGISLYKFYQIYLTFSMSHNKVSVYIC